MFAFSACVASGRKRALKDENTLGGIKKDAVDIKKSICFFIINKRVFFSHQITFVNISTLSIEKHTFLIQSWLKLFPMG